MSLVQKIPPLVSALAFGYGVGMAAPESTLASMKTAVRADAAGNAGAARSAGAAPAQAAPPPFRISASGIGGDESRELGRLRDLAAREARRAGAGQGESCDLDRPTFTRPPRYESRMDRETVDADDLDTAGAEALSKLQLPDLKISVTRRTIKYVRFFTRTDRGRGMYETWLKRSGRYQEMIQTELRERRMPEDLMWVAMIESGFDPRAKSPAGAVGLWQFMPATGSVYGLTANQHLDQRKNPRLATQAAAHHLRDLYLRFGSWDLALAAYNMGYEQLLDAIDKYGTADFNELARQEAIPSETAAYVPKIAAAAIIANNLEHFGFDKVEASRPIDAGEIAVPPGTPLKILAKASGVATSAVRMLNPDILGERVPPGRGDYIVMIPADTVSRARAALPHMLENEPLVGDDAAMLGSVDLLQGKELLRRRAHQDDDNLLSLLPHPRRGSLRAPADDDDRASAESSGDDDPAAPFVDNDADGPRRFVGHRSRRRRETMVYRVGPGDTVLGVARQFGIDAEDLAHQNKLDDGEPLKVGALIKLKVRKDLIDDLSASDKDTKGGKAKDGKDEKPQRAHPHKKGHRETT
jgi:membrane-bound lytic murein transglycosylase D